MKRFAIPLASYVAVTVVVPILNGAAYTEALAEHVVLAAGLPIALAVVLARVLPHEADVAETRSTMRHGKE